MKKRLAVFVTGVLASSMILGGCQASKGLETDNLKITKYKGVEVAQVEKPEEVTDEAVEQQIQSTLEAFADTKEITDRAVEDGDDINVDFVGKVDGEEFEGGSFKDYSITVGAGGFIDGFVESMVGHNVGDTYDWNGTFPENYGNTELAGKDVTFTITINSIQESVIPELDDEFVAKVSDKSKTVDEYKKEVKEALTKEAEASYVDQLGMQVWEAVLANTTVEKYEQEDMDELINPVIEEYKKAAKDQEMEYVEFLEQMGTTEEEFKKTLDEQAKERLKQDMVIEAIAEKEKIEVTEKNYEEQLKILAETYGYEDADALKEVLEEEDLKQIVRYNLVRDYLVDNCIQKAD